MIHWPLPQLLLQLCLPTMLPSYQLLLWGRFHREKESKGELLKIDIRAGEGQEKAVRIPLGASRTPRPEGTPKPRVSQARAGHGGDLALPSVGTHTWLWSWFKALQHRAKTPPQVFHMHTSHPALFHPAKAVRQRGEIPQPFTPLLPLEASHCNRGMQKGK